MYRASCQVGPTQLLLDVTHLVINTVQQILLSQAKVSSKSVGKPKIAAKKLKEMFLISPAGVLLWQCIILMSLYGILHAQA